LRKIISHKRKNESDDDYDSRIRKTIKVFVQEVVQLYDGMNDMEKINEYVQNLVMEYTDQKVYEKKIFTKDYILNECTRDLSLALGSIEKKLKENEIKLVEDFFSKESEWLVKVAVCEAQTKKTNLLKMFSPETTSGLLHVGIQLGPYLFDWLITSDVRIRRVFSCDSVILLSPNADSSINPSDQETREAICEFINNFRRKEYSISSHNSRHFVDGMLNALNIQTNWSKIGSKPIEKFISSMTNVDRNNIPLSFFEIEKKYQMS